jgi:hypothetical protein
MQLIKKNDLICSHMSKHYSTKAISTLTEKTANSDNKSELNIDSDDEIKMKNILTNKDYQITTYTVRSIFTDFLEEENIILRPS